MRFLDWLLTQIELLPAETISINDACGRILAEDVTAGESVPPFRRSAMDGYALKGEETNGASDYGPLRLKIIGQSFPGDPFNGEIKPGEAVRIMTGAPVPEGADAVLPAEMTEEKLDIVEISGSVPPGKNVGAIGEDIKAGTVVLRRARQLRPQDVGLLASIGTAAVNVVRKPKVRLLITGNELYPAGKEKPPHTIFDSNSPMLQALIIRDQGEIESRRQLADDRESIAKGLTEPGAEVILVSGGSSVGAEDHAPSLVDEFG